MRVVARSLLALAALASGASSCSTLLPSQVYEHPSVTAESPDSAEVYLIRSKAMAATLARLVVHLDHKRLLKVHDGTFCRFFIAPGAHVVSAVVGGGKTETALRLEAGRTYYFDVHAAFTDQAWETHIHAIDAEEAEEYLNTYRWVNEELQQ